MPENKVNGDNIKLFGKQREIALLSEMSENDRLPHGIMLTGEKGLGKRTLAKWCAMLYLCSAPENNMPCGKCRSCRNIISGEHADVIYAKGDKYTKDSVRDNVRFASTLPNDSDTRVFIYEDCEEMTEEQQNVLLKAIEEPSRHNRYIFTCSNTSAILETIMSRLVCIPVSDMTAQECVSCLEYNGCDSDKAKQSVELYGTNPGKILEILSDEKRIKLYDTAEKISVALSQKNEYSAAVVLTACMTREELYGVITILYEHVTDALRTLETGGGQSSQPLLKLTKARLYALYEVLNGFMLMDGTNINVKLMQAYIPAKLFAVLQ